MISMTIQLTRGMVAIVDECDYEWLSQFRWGVAQARRGANCYACRWRGGGVGAGHMWMHREILKPPIGLFVDHIDRNGLNNVRSNLRLCTNSQNQQNSRRQGAYSSKYKGVFRDKRKQTWRAIIKCDGKIYHLGSYRAEEDAARAYDSEARRRFGEFALPNFAL